MWQWVDAVALKGRSGFQRHRVLWHHGFAQQVELERRGLVAGQQVRVPGERERGGVVAEGAAELEEIGPATQVQGCEGVAERVEARPGRAGLLDDRLQVPAAQVAGL